MPEETVETVEVEFVHHFTDTSGETPVDYVPGQSAPFPADTARGLIASKLAVATTAKTSARAPRAEAPAPSPAPATE